MSGLDDPLYPSFMTTDFATKDDRPTPMQALMETENSAVSLAKFVEGVPTDFDKVDPFFDSVAETETLGDMPESQRLRQIRARNKGEFDWMYGNYNREIQNREVISDLGMMKSFGMGLLAEGTDPVGWLMAVIPLTRATTLLGGMAKGARIGGYDAVATEVVRSNTQVERGLAESTLNVGGGMLFGSVLGSFAYRAEIKGQLADAKESFVVDNDGKLYTRTEEGVGTNSAGAAEVRTYNKYADKEFQDDLYNKVEREEMTPEEFNEEVATEAIKQSEPLGSAVTGKVAFLTPVQRMMHSPNPEVRGLGSDMMESSVLLQMHKDFRYQGHALDTKIETKETIEQMSRLEINNRHYTEFVGTKSVAKQVGRDVIARLKGDKDHVSLKKWNEGISDATDAEGKLDPGLYSPELTEALNKAATELHARHVAFEDELIEAGVLFPENFEAGMKIDEAVAGLEARARGIDVTDERLLKEVQKQEIRQAVSKAEIDQATVKKFDQEVADKYKADTGKAKARLTAVEKKISKADPKVRRELEARFKQYGNPYLAREKKALAAYKSTAKNRPSSRKADRKELAAWQKVRDEAKQNYTKAKETKVERGKFEKKQQLLQQKYRQYPNKSEMIALKKERADLEGVINQPVPKDVTAEIAYKKNLRTVKRTEESKISKSRTRSRTAYEGLERNRAAMEDTRLQKEAKWKEQDEFIYDPHAGDPQGGGWYRSRIFKTYDVHANMDEFIRRGTDDIIEQLREIAEGVSKTGDDVKAALDDWRVAKNEGRGDIEGMVESVWDKITSSHTGHILPSASMSKRFLLQRKFTVRNRALRGDPNKGEISFIENDYIASSKAHIRSMTPQLVMKQNGFNYGEKMLKANERWKKMIRDNPKQAKKYRRLQTKQMKDAAEMYKYLNNALGKPDNPFSAINQMKDVMMNWNVMRLLGSMPISALPDLGNIITRLGLATISSNLAKLAMHTTDFKTGLKAVRKLNLVSERMLASRMSQQTMIGDMSPGMSGISRVSHQQANYMVTATGMNHWNQMLKEFVMVSYSDEIMGIAIRLHKNPNSLSMLQKTKFASGGIDKADFDYLYKMFDEFGDTEGGLKIPNVDQWPKSAQKTKFLNTLKKESDVAIVTPGAGDLPLWMRSHVGGMVGQFKSFSFAATNKILIPGVQRMAMGDPNAMAGFMTQLALGAVVYGTKMKLQGKEVDTEWSTLSREAIDRSGYFGIYTDMNAMLEKLTRGEAGLQGIYKQFGIESPELSRYYTRPLLGDLIGPSGGLIEEGNRIVGSMFSGEYSRGDISSFRRMIPYQNLWQLRRGVTEIQDAANERLVE